MDSKKWKINTREQEPKKEFPIPIPTTAAEKVMSIDVIRWKLFRGFLSAADLLACRLVCKKWTTEATSVLLLPRFERSLCVTFKYTINGPNAHNYVHEPTGRSLNEWLQTRKEAQNCPFSRQFPCTNFKFVSRPLERNKDSCRFFMGVSEESESGSEVKTTMSYVIRSLSLAIWEDSYGLDVAPFLQLLRPWVTHLKYLHLKSAPRYYKTEAPIYCPPLDKKDWVRPYSPTPNPNPNEPDQDELAVLELEEKFQRIQFIALETLKMGDMGTFFVNYLNPPHLRYTHKIVTSVLSRAHNLKRTIDPESRNLKAIWLEKKIQTVHSWFFVPRCVAITYPNWTDKPETSIFMEEQPALKEFGIDLQEMGRKFLPPEHQSLSLVLKKSQRSLEKIWDIFELLKCSGYGLEIPIPKLENVTTLTQGPPYKPHPDDPQNPVHEAARSNLNHDAISRICPNVRHLQVNGPRPWNFNSSTDFAHLRLFDQFDPLVSVSKVTIHFDCDSCSSLTDLEIGSILRLCPNLNLVQFICPGSRPLTLFPLLFGRVLENFKHVRQIVFKFFSEFGSTCNHLEDPLEWGLVVSQMDAAVTGFSPEKCTELALQLREQAKGQAEKLLREPADYLTVQNLELELNCPRTPSSILELKDLLCLRFEFDQKLRRKPLPRLFSVVSLLYGFDVLAHRQSFHLDCPKQLFHHFSAT